MRGKRRVLWAAVTIAFSGLMLTAISFPEFAGRQQHQENAARRFMEVIVTSLNEYRAAKGIYPALPDWCREDWLEPVS